MMTNRDPGELGLYGFRNRSEYGYDKLAVANSSSIHEETVWDILSREGKDSIIIGVPPTHPRHVLYAGEGNSFRNAIHEYYKYVARWLGNCWSLQTRIRRCSSSGDHGAKRMDGAIALNEWLVQKRYLALKRYPTEPTPFDKLEVDWSRTKAWGEGGYYGRISLNIEGREPQGAPKSEYDSLRRQLKEELEALGDTEGNPISTRVVLSEEVYRHTRNIAPDLSVFFGDLYWRSSGMVGGGEIHNKENDTGPDGANHNWDGIFLMPEGKDPGCGSSTTALEGLRLFDVAPTILDTFRIAPLTQMQGETVGWPLPRAV